jgi:ribosomal protein S18 acetylase RimI-like enzyme
MTFWNSLFRPTPPETLAQKYKLRKVPNQDGTIFLGNDHLVDPYELEALCDAVGWARRPIHKVRIALQHSFVVITLWQCNHNFRKLIGFARATSDYAFNATIWDVVVHPKFQGRGLGKTLISEVIRELRKADITNISLFADAPVVSFYEKLGFIPDPEGIKGMFWSPSE